MDLTFVDMTGCKQAHGLLVVWSVYMQSECAGSCSNHSFLIPFLLALPYILRFIQCIIVNRALNDTSQFFNAIKYTTALPVVFLSFVKYSVPLTSWHSFWKPLWVASAVVNSSYSFYWDVERDWDIRLFHPGAMPPDTTRQRCLTYRCSFYCRTGKLNVILLKAVASGCCKCTCIAQQGLTPAVSYSLI
jgi:hypothetical protein